MPNINAGPARRFESGGSLVLNDGATAYTVLLYEPGSLKFTPPTRQALYYTDRGSQQAPIEGDDTLGEFEIVVKVVGYEATSMRSLALAVSINGLKKEYTSLVASILDGRGGSTVLKHTMGSVSFDAAPECQAGTDFDKWTFKGKYRTHVEAAS